MKYNVLIKQPKELKKKEPPCKHDFKTFKQTIHPNNDQFSGSAYFVVRGCIKCKEKKYTDYVVL